MLPLLEISGLQRLLTAVTVYSCHVRGTSSRTLALERGGEAIKTRREIERLCPAAPPSNPKHTGTAYVSGRAGEGVSYPVSNP
jgi:hypothetical protein